MISKSWEDLSPSGALMHREPFSEYWKRVQNMVCYRHIPQAVLEQWIYLHHDNEWMVKNYAWIDYAAVKFKLEEWNCNSLLRVKAIEDFERLITGIENEFNSVCALMEDELFWRTHGTWRVPPIILDVSSVKMNAPVDAELREPYQLVEGHSRMRNLLISERQNLFLAEMHKVFVMRAL